MHSGCHDDPQFFEVGEPEERAACDDPEFVAGSFAAGGGKTQAGGRVGQRSEKSPRQSAGFFEEGDGEGRGGRKQIKNTPKINLGTHSF